MFPQCHQHSHVGSQVQKPGQILCWMDDKGLIIKIEEASNHPPAQNVTSPDYLLPSMSPVGIYSLGCCYLWESLIKM